MIKVKNLNKLYDKTQVLFDISVQFNKGAITGLLGPNGAGKTTLVSILTGIIPWDSGNIEIGSFNLNKEKKKIHEISSIVPQSLAFYPQLTAYENLEYFGSLYNLKGKKLKERMEFCIEVAQIKAFLHKIAEKNSGGMNRRLNLAIGIAQ